METGLKFGPLGEDAAHLCVDMQKLFAPGSPWGAPWVARRLPAVTMLASARPERSFFTRFIPPRSLTGAPGSWGRYYAAWPEILRETMSEEWLRLLPELEALAPAGHVFDKSVYSPWWQTGLEATLRAKGVTTLVVSGSETDICVLATVLGAVDRGFRVIVAVDAVCSSSDETHDAVLSLFGGRMGRQIETATTGQILEDWRVPA